MRKIRVMHILNTGLYSGAENVAISIINNLNDRVDSTYVSLCGPIKEVLAENDIKYYPVSKVSVSNIRRAIKEIKPDIIHAHDFTAGIISSVSTFRIPIINHLHNNSPWIKKLCVNSLVYGLSCLRYKKILTVSQAVMNEYIFGKALKSKTKVVGNPIDLQRIRHLADVAELKEESDIVFLGRLSKQKNPFEFIDIVKELLIQLPNLKVFMVGDGELRQEVEDKINELDLKRNITLWGFQKNPYGLVKNSKVMCMPSLWEGFGLAAVEGLALGKPVIANPVGGLTGIINEKCGCLCNEREDFINALYKLLSDSVVLSDKSDNALICVEVFDNINEYANLVFKEYKKTL